MYTYLLKCKTSFLPQIWHLSIRGRLKFQYEVPNQTMQSQNPACITKSSCDIYAFSEIFRSVH